MQIKAKEQQAVEAKPPLKKARANQRLLGPQVQKVSVLTAQLIEWGGWS